MKKLVIVLLAALFAFPALAQDESLKPGEKIAITFLDFDFTASYWAGKSRTCTVNGEEKKTVEEILRSLEKAFNEKYGVTLEPAKLEEAENSWFTTKCFPKMKTKDALKLGYDKIIEIRAYMHPSAAMGYGPVSNPKPVMNMDVTIYDKSGKKIWSKSAMVKEEQRQMSLGGFNVSGGYTGDQILELYREVLAKIFEKADKKADKDKEKGKG
jgi:hypothetical protein